MSIVDPALDTTAIANGTSQEKGHMGLFHKIRRIVS